MAEDEHERKSDDVTRRFRRLLSDEGESGAEDVGDSAEELSTSSLSHHPTGEPERTGGWYGEEGLDDQAEDREGQEQGFRGSEGGIIPPAEAGKYTPPPADLGETPPKPPPAIGTYGLPLPRRVPETDVNATRVAPRSGGQTTTRPAVQSGGKPPLPPIQRPGGRQVSVPPPQPPTIRQAYPPRQNIRQRPPLPPTGGGGTSEGGFDWRVAFGCLTRSIIIGLFGLVMVMLCGASILLVQYYRIAKDLPNIEDLRQRASQFETTRIFDRKGNVIYEILDPNAGRRTYVTLDKISPYLVAATIATEDKEYYSHPGYNIFAIFRAFYQNTQSGDTVSGASTITQQLARNLLFTPEERSERSYERKLREAILAAELTRRYTKDEILELYLNENYYGNLSYGVEAAAETYFRTTADKLTLGQAAFLAGLPQAPSVYDVYTNREQTIKRQSDVLILMYKVSQEQGCIYVSNSPQRVCVDAVNATAARDEIVAYEFPSPNVPMRYPHWVTYIKQQLESQYDPQTIYRSGFSVYTTLDPELQELGERLVREQVARLREKNATSGALVAIQPGTGEILAMIGSADFYNEENDGQVNMAISPRQPGSAIKPITYLAAFEKGWTAATLIWDVPSEFPPSGNPDDLRPPYKPINYDERFHGPVTVRTALANSYNVPAVKALYFVGIYDNPAIAGEDGLLAMARRLGISTLTRNDYGLSLTLGGGDVTLLELTGVYATIANAGRKVPLISITKILDHEGNQVFEANREPVQQVLRPEHTFLITSILADNEARAPMFGRDSVLNLPFPAAVKTGTTNDFRDNWTLGFTPDLAVGVWVGNPDYTPMNDVSGVTGAAPIWAEFMKVAAPKVAGGRVTPFSRPAGIIDKVICAVSGTEPSEWCPKQTTEIFAADQPPLPKEEDLWQKLEVDTWTGLRASEECGNFRKEVFALNVKDAEAIKWIKKDAEGKAWAEKMGFKKPIVFAPERACKTDDPRPKVEFLQPRNDDTITSPELDIYAIADATKNFKSYQLDYGLGAEPKEWETLLKSNEPSNGSDKIYHWDVSELPAGLVTLRLTIFSSQDTYAELKIRINLQVPTPTPTVSPTVTPSPTWTSTSLPSQTPTPSLTPAPSTPTPTETPTVTSPVN